MPVSEFSKKNGEKTPSFKFGDRPKWNQNKPKKTTAKSPRSIYGHCGACHVTKRRKPKVSEFIGEATVELPRLGQSSTNGAHHAYQLNSDYYRDRNFFDKILRTRTPTAATTLPLQQREYLSDTALNASFLRSALETVEEETTDNSSCYYVPVISVKCTPRKEEDIHQRQSCSANTKCEFKLPLEPMPGKPMHPLYVSEESSYDSDQALLNQNQLARLRASSRNSSGKSPNFPEMFLKIGERGCNDVSPNRNASCGILKSAMDFQIQPGIPDNEEKDNRQSPFDKNSFLSSKRSSRRIPETGNVHCSRYQPYQTFSTIKTPLPENSCLGLSSVTDFMKVKSECDKDRLETHSSRTTRSNSLNLTKLFDANSVLTKNSQPNSLHDSAISSSSGDQEKGKLEENVQEKKTDQEDGDSSEETIAGSDLKSAEIKQPPPESRYGLRSFSLSRSSLRNAFCNLSLRKPNNLSSTPTNNKHHKQEEKLERVTTQMELLKELEAKKKIDQTIPSDSHSSDVTMMSSSDILSSSTITAVSSMSSTTNKLTSGKKVTRGKLSDKTSVGSNDAAAAGKWKFNPMSLIYGNREKKQKAAIRKKKPLPKQRKSTKASETCSTSQSSASSDNRLKPATSKTTRSPKKKVGRKKSSEKKVTSDDSEQKLSTAPSVRSCALKVPENTPASSTAGKAKTVPHHDRLNARNIDGKTVDDHPRKSVRSPPSAVLKSHSKPDNIPPVKTMENSATKGRKLGGYVGSPDLPGIMIPGLLLHENCFYDHTSKKQSPRYTFLDPGSNRAPFYILATTEPRTHAPSGYLSDSASHFPPPSYINAARVPLTDDESYISGNRPLSRLQRLLAMQEKEETYENVLRTPKESKRVVRFRSRPQTINGLEGRFQHEKSSSGEYFCSSLEESDLSLKPSLKNGNGKMKCVNGIERPPWRPGTKVISVDKFKLPIDREIRFSLKDERSKRISQCQNNLYSSYASMGSPEEGNVFTYALNVVI